MRFRCSISLPLSSSRTLPATGWSFKLAKVTPTLKESVLANAWGVDTSLTATLWIAAAPGGVKM
jgi:hypothetical protein